MNSINEPHWRAFGGRPAANRAVDQWQTGCPPGSGVLLADSLMGVLTLAIYVAWTKSWRIHPTAHARTAAGLSAKQADTNKLPDISKAGYSECEG
jgi:hypothetical protein